MCGDVIEVTVLGGFCFLEDPCDLVESAALSLHQLLVFADMVGAEAAISTLSAFASIGFVFE